MESRRHNKPEKYRRSARNKPITYLVQVVDNSQALIMRYETQMIVNFS